jgi:hypothetical protein
MSIVNGGPNALSFDKYSIRRRPLASLRDKQELKQRQRPEVFYLECERSSLYGLYKKIGIKN